MTTLDFTETNYNSCTIQIAFDVKMSVLAAYYEEA